MRTSLVTRCVANWMLRRSDSRRSSLRSFNLFKSGLLRHLDASGNHMETTYGDPLVRTTPFHLLPASLKDALGGQYTWASWLQHPLSGFGLHFFLTAFELGKLTGNYLEEFSQKPKVYFALGEVSAKVSWRPRGDARGTHHGGEDGVQATRSRDWLPSTDPG